VTAWQHSQRLALTRKISSNTFLAPLSGPQRQLTNLSLPDGTHVAALIAGKDFGVAKQTTIRCVKIKDKNESMDFKHLIKAVNAVFEEIRRSQEPSVILMSLTTPDFPELDNVVCTPPC
jgi:hypothetical protein